MNATTLNAVRAPQQFETIIVNPLTLNIGAEIFGVDLSKPLAEGKFNEILAAIYTHQVIFFRDQHLSAAQLVDFAKLLGEPQPSAESSFAKIAAYPEIDVLDFDGERPPHNTKELWHTDFSGREKPTLGSVLYALEVPSSGGDTVWTSLTAAYDALSAPLKRYLSGLQAEHHTLKAFGDDIRSVLWQDDAGRQRFAELRAIPPVAHPVVRTHPSRNAKPCSSTRGLPSACWVCRRRKATQFSAICSHTPKHRNSRSAFAGRNTALRCGTTASPSITQSPTTGSVASCTVSRSRASARFSHPQ